MESGGREKLLTRVPLCQADENADTRLLLSRLLRPSPSSCSHSSDASHTSSSTADHSPPPTEITQTDMTELLLLCESSLQSPPTLESRESCNELSAIGLLNGILKYWDSILRKSFSNMPNLKRELLVLTTQLPLVVSDVECLLHELLLCGTLRFEPTDPAEPTAELLQQRRMRGLAWRMITDSGACTNVPYFLRLFITQLQHSLSTSSTSTSIHTASSYLSSCSNSTFITASTSSLCNISTSSTSSIPVKSILDSSKAIPSASSSSITFASLLSMLQSFLRHFVTETRETIINQCNEVRVDASHTIQRVSSSLDHISLPIHAMTLNDEKSAPLYAAEIGRACTKAPISTEQVHHLLLQLHSDEWDHVLPHMEKFLLDSENFDPAEPKQWEDLRSHVLRCVRSAKPQAAVNCHLSS